MTKSHKKFLGIIFMTIGLVGMLLSPHVASAQQLFPSIIPNCDQNLKQVNGFYTVPLEEQCDFNDFIQLFVNLFDWGLAILSILSVSFFIIGGTFLLLSGGKEQRIVLGKSILTNTTLGLAIALGSWLIINTVIGLLIGNGSFQNVQVFGRNWWGVPTCSSQYSEVCSQNDLHEGCGDVETNYVSQLQRALNNAPGCPPVEVDGCFGPSTKSAVHDFNGAQNPPITPTVVAGYDTWQALNEGKGCSLGVNFQEPATAVAPEIPGCCVQTCKQGIPNTVESNGSDGCKEVFPTATWSSANGGSCDESQQNLTGCCVGLNGTCYDKSNAFWCTAAPASGGGGGSYYQYRDCSLVSQCNTSNTVSCSQ